MILLDTHVWVWWVNESPMGSKDMLRIIQEHQEDGLGVSIISCWEVAKLVERGRLELSTPVEHCHRDPADQMLVATARVYDIPLLTADSKLLDYPHVKIAR